MNREPTLLDDSGGSSCQHDTFVFTLSNFGLIAMKLINEKSKLAAKSKNKHVEHGWCAVFWKAADGCHIIIYSGVDTHTDVHFESGEIDILCTAELQLCLRGGSNENLAVWHFIISLDKNGFRYSNQ